MYQYSSEKDHSEYAPLIREMNDEGINTNMPHPDSLFVSHPIKSANNLSKFLLLSSKVISVSVY
jgi:hypothetical protein